MCCFRKGADCGEAEKRCAERGRPSGCVRAERSHVRTACAIQGRRGDVTDDEVVAEWREPRTAPGESVESQLRLRAKRERHARQGARIPHRSSVNFRYCRPERTIAYYCRLGFGYDDVRFDPVWHPRSSGWRQRENVLAEEDIAVPEPDTGLLRASEELGCKRGDAECAHRQVTSLCRRRLRVGRRGR
jgi:hypothetical protein